MGEWVMGEWEWEGRERRCKGKEKAYGRRGYGGMGVRVGRSEEGDVVTVKENGSEEKGDVRGKEKGYGRRGYGGMGMGGKRKDM